MEDSGFDSGDRVANFMQNKNNKKNIANIDDVAFRNPSLISGSNSVEASQVLIDQKSHHHHHLHEHNKKLSNINTCKSLHRKLEEKVNRAKRNFLHNEKLNQLENDIEEKKSISNLISIERLPFPRSSNSENHKPLVEYKSDNSDDDDEVTTFFPIHKKPKKSRSRKQQQKHKDVDTFSIQEMTIIESESDGNDGDKSSEEDDCDSQLNLELPSRTNDGILIKIRQMFCCTSNAQNMF
ncbi:hypothetical protein PVAND_001029 [Polypedilum vanderplanki]|uniref:Uncharacterized protein n=1 Tax=Polypedilum vanderplanki TaxID=319348 RepID=A0A9J6BN10_POLVA|nr:hypothetical protein PVAND_001029 [Polypedilum vanderplanki]